MLTKDIISGFNLLSLAGFVIMGLTLVLNRSGRAVFMAGNPSLIEVSYLDIMTRDLCVSGCPHATRADVRGLGRTDPMELVDLVAREKVPDRARGQTEDGAQPE